MEKSNIPKPLADRIIILPDNEIKDEGGLSILPQFQAAITTGVVVAVGNGIYAFETGVLINPEVSIGDHVKYNPNAAFDIEIDGVEYKMLREKDILLIF